MNLLHTLTIFDMSAPSYSLTTLGRKSYRWPQLTNLHPPSSSLQFTEMSATLLHLWNFSCCFCGFFPRESWRQHSLPLAGRPLWFPAVPAVGQNGVLVTCIHGEQHWTTKKSIRRDSIVHDAENYGFCVNRKYGWFIHVHMVCVYVYMYYIIIKKWRLTITRLH